MPETAGKTVQSDFAVAGNLTEEGATARETKGLLDEVLNRFDYYE
jgi:hypothetical protein